MSTLDAFRRNCRGANAAERLRSEVCLSLKTKMREGIRFARESPGGMSRASPTLPGVVSGAAHGFARRILGIPTGTLARRRIFAEQTERLSEVLAVMGLRNYHAVLQGSPYRELDNQLGPGGRRNQEALARRRMRRPDHRRFPLQRPRPADAVPELCRSARQVSHQARFKPFPPLARSGKKGSP